MLNGVVCNERAKGAKAIHKQAKRDERQREKELEVEGEKKEEEENVALQVKNRKKERNNSFSEVEAVKS